MAVAYDPKLPSVIADPYPVFTDPPKHTQLRGLMNTAFTTRAVEQLRSRVEALVTELIDQVCDRGEMDLIRDFAWPLPITVIAEMLGVPREDRAALKIWSDELAAFVGSALATSDKYERAARSGVRMSDYFRDLIGQRRASPRDDLLSALVAADEQHDPASEEELVATA